MTQQLTPELARILVSALQNYTNPRGSSYNPRFDKDIRQAHPEWFVVAVPSSEQRKREILDMPVGCPRPAIGEHSLASSFNSYICKAHPCYDAEFDMEIRVRQPSWFVDTAAEKKKLILELPIGSPRPICGKHHLGLALLQYTNKSSSSYNAEFDRDIRAKHPLWFIDTVAESKKLLLAMPVGCKRPTQGSGRLAHALSNYIGKSNRSYDAEFDRKIRAKHPGWFDGLSARIKQEILSIPPGSPKPLYRKDNHLGRFLRRHTNKGNRCYDPEFDMEIRAKQPEWFEVVTATEKKRQILAMPRGCARPVGKDNPIRRLLANCTNRNSSYYDAEFDKAIRVEHPQWFEDTPEEKKRQLLTMPEGSPRPVPGKDCLGCVLSNYTGKSNRSYDAEFDKAIRARHPRWFKK